MSHRETSPAGLARIIDRHAAHAFAPSAGPLTAEEHLHETDDDAPEAAKCFFAALGVYRGLWPDWFDPLAPRRGR